MRKTILAAAAALLACLLLAAPAPAVTTGGPNVTATGQYFAQAPMTQIVRPANTNAYAAGQIVCGSTCAPITVNVTGGSNSMALLNRVTLLKSGSTTTNASFIVWFYSRTPTLAGSSGPLADQSAYVGPFAADMPYYLGNAACATTNNTNDGTAQVWFECTLSNPNTSGALVVQSGLSDQSIKAVIEANGAYTPAAGETFSVYISGLY